MTLRYCSYTSVNDDDDDKELNYAFAVEKIASGTFFSAPGCGMLT
jgi:hypothetical protein